MANLVLIIGVMSMIPGATMTLPGIAGIVLTVVSTIADANITTLITAIILFAVGTGAVKGFAVTLSIGILTSMFTAIIGTRCIVNLLYGGKRVDKLSI